MKRSTTGLMLLSVGSMSVNAATLTVSDDVNLTGVLTSSAVYLANTGGGGHDSVDVTDFSIGINNGEAKVGGVSYIGVAGLRKIETLLDTDVATGEGGSFGLGFDFGYATYRPIEAMTVELGFILGTIGSEASPSWLNGNMSRGLAWYSQPTAYNGGRLRYSLGSVGLFAEGNFDTSQGTTSGAMNFSLGASGSAGGANYSVTYYDGKDSRNIVDAVFSMAIGTITVGTNVDYYMIDKAPSGTDSSAFGVALYVTPKMGKFELPVRAEYVSDGTSGVYTNASGTGVDNASSVTLTPTLRVSDNAFVRGEVGYVMTKNKVFSDKDGAPIDSQIKAGLQIGYKF